MKRLETKKIQKLGNSTNAILISKEAMKKLGLKAQANDCIMVEIVDEANKRLIFQKISLS